MKRIIIITAVLLLTAGIAQAFSVATTSDSASGQTVTLVTNTSGIFLAYISASNSENIARRVDVWDSGTYAFSMMVPAKDDRGPYKIEGRFTSSVKVYMDGAYMSVTILYNQGYSGGHYIYGVRNDATQNTVYSSPDDLISVIFCNWNNGNTGVALTIADSYTNKIRMICPHNDTKFENFDRFHLNLFQATAEKDSTAYAIIRRE